MAFGGGPDFPLTLSGVIALELGDGGDDLLGGADFDAGMNEGTGELEAEVVAIALQWVAGRRERRERQQARPRAQVDPCHPRQAAGLVSEDKDVALERGGRERRLSLAGADFKHDRLGQVQRRDRRLLLRALEFELLDLVRRILADHEPMAG